MRGIKRYILWCILPAVGLFTACASNPPTEDIQSIAQPSSGPVKTRTSFDDSLLCMDSLFVQEGKVGIPITTGALKDDTKKVKAGIEGMVRSALSDMSIKSRAFIIVDSFTDPTILQQKQATLGKTTGQAPFYYIKGGITQLDKGVQTKKKGFGIGTTDASIGNSTSVMSSLMAVDLAIYDFRSSAQVPGASVSNSISVSRSRDGDDLKVKLGNFGIVYEDSTDNQEGTHQALRNLLHLSLVELLGRFTHTPYEQCLALDTNDPKLSKDNNKAYQQNQEDEEGNSLNIKAIQEGLKADGLYKGDITGQVSPELKTAIKLYQTRNSLTITGKPSFELYNHLLTRGKVKSNKPDGAKVPEEVIDDNKFGEGKVTLTDAKGNTAPVFKINEAMKFKLSSPTGAYALCYYQDATGATMRFYPTKFTGFKKEHAFLLPNKPVILPDTKKFHIAALSPGKEYVTCYSYHQAFVNLLPKSISDKTLTKVIPGGLGEVDAEIKKRIPNINKQTIEITVK